MKKNKSKKKLSGFKKFLMIYSAVIILAAAVLLILLNGVLKDYEAGEPNNVMDEYVNGFDEKQLDRLLKEADLNLTEFETADVLKEYFTAKIGEKKVSYKRKSGEFTSAKPVYSLMAGDEQIAKVTLAEKGENGHGFMEWKIGSIELADAKTDNAEITVSAPAQAKVYINGVEVSETYKAGEDKPVDITKNLADFGKVSYDRTYKITGLVKKPEITAVLGETSLNVTAEENNYTVSYPADEALLAEQKEHITEIFEHYGKYIINRGNLQKLLSFTKGKAYTYLSDIPAVWAYLYGEQYTYEFRNEAVSNLVKYSDSCYTVDVYFDLYVDYTRDNTTYNTSMTYVMIKENDTWYLADFVQHQVEGKEK